MIYMAGQLVSWLVTFVSISWIPRSLGEKGIGQMGLGSAAVFNVGLILSLSIEQYLTPAVARNPSEARAMLRSTLGMRVAMLPIMLIVCSIALYGIHADATVWALGRLYMVLQAITFFYTPCRNVLVGFEEARKVALCDLGQVCAGLFMLPVLHYGVVICVEAWTLANIPVMLWGIWCVYKRVGNIWPTFDFARWWVMIRASLAFLVNDVAAPIMAYTTVYLLNLYGGGDTTVGVYSQSQKLLGAFLFIPTAIASALLPSISRLAETDYPAFRRMQQRVTMLMIVVGMPILILALMLAVPFCSLLYGASKFQALPVALQCCGITVIPLYVTIILYRFLVAERKNAVWGLFMFFTMVLNAILCRLLIPYMMLAPHIHSGAAGATISFAITETISMVAAFILLKVNPINGESIGRLFRALLAAAAMVGVMWVTPDLFFVLRGALGMLVFGVLAWGFKVLGEEDQQKLAEIVMKRLPGQKG